MKSPEWEFFRRAGHWLLCKQAVNKGTHDLNMLWRMRHDAEEMAEILKHGLSV